jgi:hypothetical protein
MILNMHRDDVPHFVEGCPPNVAPDDPRSIAAERAELEWLALRGLTAVNVGFSSASTDICEVIEGMGKRAHGAPLVLGCSVNGANHSVVICDGALYNPNDASVTGPHVDGNWWLTIYSVGPNWRSPLLRDRLRGLLRKVLAMWSGTR